MPPSNRSIAIVRSRLSWLKDWSISQKDYIFRYDSVQYASLHEHDLPDVFFASLIKIQTITLTFPLVFMKVKDAFMIIQSDVW